MKTETAPRSSATRALLWWMLWAGMTAGLVAINYAMSRLPETEPAARGAGADLVGLATLLTSCLARWWVLPRVRRVQTAFVLFLVGVGLAEDCGLIGIFGGAHRNVLVILSVAGMLQWMPVFARRFFPPAPVAPTPGAD